MSGVKERSGVEKARLCHGVRVTGRSAVGDAVRLGPRSGQSVPLVGGWSRAVPAGRWGVVSGLAGFRKRASGQG